MHRTLPLGLFVLAACTAGGPPTTPKPTPDPPVIATGHQPIGDPPGRGTQGSPYAPSPLTDLARALTSLAVTVLDGNPPPPGPIAIERTRGKKLVRSEGPLPKGSDLEFFLFGIQMYAILDEGPDPNIAAGSPGPPPAAEDGSIRITGLVGATGYRVVDLSARTARKSQRLPGWLMGSVQSCNESVEALRRGRIGSLFITEADRPLFKSEDLFQRAMKELPKPDEVREAEEAAKKHPRVLGVEVDDLYLVARDKSDTSGQFFYAFEFNVDEDDGQLVLDSSPLMDVEKRDMKAHRTEDDIPTAPPPPPPVPPPPPTPRR